MCKYKIFSSTKSNRKTIFVFISFAKVLNENRIKTLCIPSWFPNKKDPTYGIFIKKYIHSISHFADVTVLNIQPVSEKGQHLKICQSNESNIKIVDIGYYSENPAIIKALSYLKAANFALKTIGFDFDIAHIHVAHPAVRIALYLQKFKKIPYIISEQWTGYVPYDNGFEDLRWYNKYIIRKGYENAKMVSCISEFLKKALIDKKLISTGKAVVVPNIVDIKNNITSLSKKTKNRIKLLTISDLRNDQKNISGLILSFKLLLEQIPDLELHHIGTGPDEKMLHTLAKDSGLLNTRVFFHGYIPNHELHEYFSMCHIFVLNSNYETFCVASAEALGHGLPVVITSCGAPLEYLNSETGVIAERNNVVSLKNAMASAIANIEKYDSTLLRNYVEKRFGQNSVKEMMRSLYEKTLFSS